jgi:ABC-type nitrate/sulfonate/bicarbonate transport system substrate-binding protein
MTTPVVNISPNNPVFDLPIYVARDEGLFQRAGIDVRFQAKYSERRASDSDPFQRLKEALFEQGKADVYNLCEWAGIDRSQRSARGAQVLALRPAVGAQAILTLDKSIQEPRDLAAVPIGINERTGSHYTTLQSLEGVLTRSEIVVEHVGVPERRYQALKERTSRAVAVMEPFISLGLKEGAHIVDLTFYRGAEVIAPHLTVEQRQAYLDAINEAADRIMADFPKYKHYVTEQTRGALAPHELSNHYVRYTHYMVYEPKRFQQVYEWMRSWGLASGEADHARVVASL